jgi:hypothetical protein
MLHSVKVQTVVAVVAVQVVLDLIVDQEVTVLLTVFLELV